MDLSVFHQDGQKRSRSGRNDRKGSEWRRLQEVRRHGSPDLPVGIYHMSPQPGTPVLDMHWHAEYEFLAVEEGRATFQIGLSTYDVQAGEVLFIPGGELHGAHWPEEGASACDYSAIVFDFDWLTTGGGQDRAYAEWLAPIQRGEIGLPHHVTRAHKAAEAIFRLVTALTAEHAAQRPGMALRLKGGLLTLFAEYADAGLAEQRREWGRSRNATPQQLIRVLSYMEAEFARKLTIGELASVAGMSEGHFSRMFKLYVRKTPIAYLNAYRLQRAAQMLQQSDMSVSEAALACGFDNFSYFSKLFRSRFHCSPSEYRKN